MQALGSNSYLAMQKAENFGAFPTTPTSFRKIGMKSESLKGSINMVESTILSGNRNPKKPFRGNMATAGGIVTTLSPQIGPLLAGVFGTVAPTDLTGGKYQHIAKINSTLPNYCLEKGFPDINAYMVYLGVFMNKLSVSGKNEGEQDCTIDVLGVGEVLTLPYTGQTGNFTVGKVVTGTTSAAKGLIVADYDGGTTGILALSNVTGTFNASEALTDTATGAATTAGTLGASPVDSSITDPGHTTFDGFSVGLIQEGGSDIATVTDYSFVLDNGSKANYALGGHGIARNVIPSRVSVSGKITTLFESMAMFQKAAKFQESSLKIAYQFGTGDGSAGNEYLEFYVPELLYDKDTPLIAGPDGVLYDGPFKAYYDNDSNASAVMMTLKCTDATIL